MCHERDCRRTWLSKPLDMSNDPQSHLTKTLSRTVRVEYVDSTVSSRWTSIATIPRRQRGLPRWPTMLVVLAFGCDENAASGRDVTPSLSLFVFPNEVEPRGQATVAVELREGACPDAGGCVICLGVPKSEGAGLLFGPPGSADPAGSPVVQMSTKDSNSLTSITYQAPDREASEVVSAALYEADKDCSVPGGDPLATTTERVTIRRPSPDAGEEGPGGAGGQAAAGEE